MGLMKKINGLLYESPRDFIYWTRLALAIIAAFVCSILRLEMEGLVVSLIFYLLSYILFRYILNINSEKVGGESKLYTTGLGTYLATWITVWVLFYTYLARR